LGHGNRSIAADGLPGRYAAALFELALADKALERVASDLATLARALCESADLKRLTSGRTLEGTGAALQAVARALGLSPLVSRFLGVVAQNRRLGQLGAMIRAFEARLDERRGVMTARVTSAHPLSDDQVDALKRQLVARTGHDMRLDIAIDPAILGGLVVRIGSMQIDSSIRTRLDRLAQQMKGS